VFEAFVQLIFSDLYDLVGFHNFFDLVDLVIVLDFTGSGQNLVIIYKITVFVCLEYSWDGFLDPYYIVRSPAKHVCLTVGCA
jgi:hypothetical protein